MIYVLGVGNVLMGDDGFGPAAVRAFDDEYDAGRDVEVVDLGTPGLDLSPWLCDAERAIIVDTVKAGAPPGTLRMYDKADLLRCAPQARIGPHDPGLKEALLTLEFAGRGPREVALVGVVPERVGLSTELSPCLRDAIPKAIDAIVVTLARYGRPAVARARSRGGASSWMTVHR